MLREKDWRNRWEDLQLYFRNAEQGAPAVRPVQSSRERVCHEHSDMLGPAGQWDQRSPTLGLHLPSAAGQ